MRRLLVSAALVVIAASCAKDTGITAPGSTLITPASATVHLGETVQFSAFPLDSAPRWQVREGMRYGLISSNGLYQAPYSDPGPGPITVRITSGSLSAEAHVALVVTAQDTTECYGATQSGLPGFGEYEYVEVLPEAITKLAPVYPDIAREAGIDGQVMVQALVCTSGHVLDVRVVKSIPALDQAAIDAVRWWTFTPAMSQGSPVAVWVAIPVKFSLHGPN